MKYGIILTDGIIIGIAIAAALFWLIAHQNLPIVMGLGVFVAGVMGKSLREREWARA